MCGIAGYLSFDNAAKLKLNTEHTLNSIRHRGPDAQGVFAEGPVWLGHTRLSILDPGAASDQPMISRDERYVLVYNGEIYNFKELASEVKVSLKTNSDTEVLLEGIAAHGIGFAKKCNGMFAFALYDRQLEKLFLCRDHMGIKPLFIAHAGGTLMFASELKAITAMAQQVLGLSLNYDSIKKFLHLGYIPRPATIYKEVQKMQQGTSVSFSTSGIQQEEYWNLRQQLQPRIHQIGEQESKAQLKELLENVVQCQMISDVPFGALLSGGIDSSLVTAIAQSVSPRPVNTFSVGFKDDKVDESQYAEKVAAHLGTEHHAILVEPKECLDIVEDLICLYDEPFADSSALPTYIVSRFAAKHVKMVLAGDGGDELFLGYGMYTWARRLAHPLVRYTKPLWPPVLRQLSNPYQRAATLFDGVPQQSLPAHIFSQEQYMFTSAEIEQLVRLPGDASLKFDNHLPRHLSAAEQQAFFDMQYYLPDDLLVKVDRASMANSLEVRPPLLDYRLVQFALNLPEAYRKKGNTSKYLLKQVLYDYVPKSFFDRPKKGFSIPLKDWLKGELSYLLHDYLKEEVLNRYDFIDKEMVRRYIKEYLGGKSYLYNRLWLLVVLMYWLENQNHAKR